MESRKVHLVAHDPGWWQAHEQARSMVFDATRGRITAVEHVGSTAVPGLVARPIIDLAARLELDDLDETRNLLLGLNYGPAPRIPPLAGVEMLQRPRRGPGPVTHQVLLVSDESSWALLLAVRDALRLSLETREDFARAKVGVAELAGDDPARYHALKDALFANLLARIAS